MRFKCIIFDCDGVLVDSEATSIGVLMDIAQEAGYKMEMPFALNQFSGQSLQYCFDYIQKNALKPLPQDIINNYRRRTYQAFKTDLKAIPNIDQLLQRLTLPRCVASNAPIEKIKLNLGLLNLSHFFEGNLFSAYDIQKWKPAPDLFLHAAKTMGFEPQECAVIEDSLAGVQAAKAGGFEVFGYASSRTASTLAAAGATVFYDMNLLDELLA
ncbi:HAD family hydrolase [Aureispira anguillae]|uniref:HAD family hydrolase n=1 Tax=Aureispira anguillae TaxID=2864201 RepID=A0A915YG52_9BACT|nr:HAD family hydrolase [Aureispira anguillae]BDS12545.1 HAD family hydrolase [Aureispira anguillae]